LLRAQPIATESAPTAALALSRMWPAIKRSAKRAPPPACRASICLVFASPSPRPPAAAALLVPTRTRPVRSPPARFADPHVTLVNFSRAAAPPQRPARALPAIPPSPSTKTSQVIRPRAKRARRVAQGPLALVCATPPLPPSVSHAHPARRSRTCLGPGAASRAPCSVHRATSWPGAATPRPMAFAQHARLGSTRRPSTTLRAARPVRLRVLLASFSVARARRRQLQCALLALLSLTKTRWVDRRPARRAPPPAGLARTPTSPATLLLFAANAAAVLRALFSPPAAWSLPAPTATPLAPLAGSCRVPAPPAAAHRRARAAGPTSTKTWLVGRQPASRATHPVARVCCCKGHVRRPQRQSAVLAPPTHSTIRPVLRAVSASPVSVLALKPDPISLANARTLQTACALAVTATPTRRAPTPLLALTASPTAALANF
jgi:hypothetical protein